MADLRTREAARRYATDGGLRDGLVSGLLDHRPEDGTQTTHGALRRAKERPCHPPCPDQYGCAVCDSTGSLPYDPWDLVRLRAYLGDEEARELVGQDWEWCPVWLERPRWLDMVTPCGEEVDEWPLSAWLDRLKRLASKLPPYRVEVECECRPFSMVQPCGECNGSGKVIHDTSAERYLLVVAAHGVAREVFEGEPIPSCGSSLGRCGGCALCALDACAQWIKCPCPTCEREWSDAAGALGLDTRWLWVPYPGDRHEENIQAAAKILGPDARDHAARSVLEAL